jgi:hypothetical protein
VPKTVKEKNDLVNSPYHGEDPMQLVLLMDGKKPIRPLPKPGLVHASPQHFILNLVSNLNDVVCREQCIVLSSGNIAWNNAPYALILSPESH